VERPSGNTKSRAQRIERHYFKKGFAIPRWRIRLTLIAAAIGLGWLGWRAVARDETAFSSGPLNSHHASFEKDCAACHGQRAGGSTINDQACLTCHDGPVHHEQQTSTPKCVDCHIEHIGARQLLGAGDNTCVACHGDLKTKDGKHTVAAQITSLASGHPEFIPLRPGHSDPGTIKFNHKVHLRKDLKGPNGNVQMECGDCHQPTGISQPWPYGKPESAEIKAVETSPSPRSLVSTRAHMQPVNFYEHCSSCHPLLVDKRIAQPAPHKKPEVVIGFLEEQFRAYIAAHPEDRKSPPGSQWIPRVKDAPSPQTADEWVRRRVEEAERLLWSKTCAECHAIDGVGVSPVPEVRKANLTARWLQHGNFDHAAHSAVECKSCHTKVNESEKTSDVLIPGIENCRACHNSEKANSSASGDCFECHQYHDWTREKPRHGSLAIPHS